MPSTKKIDVRIQSLPCFEQEGMVWIWPGDEPPKATIPSLLPPSGFMVHAEVKGNPIMLQWLCCYVSFLCFNGVLDHSTDSDGATCWAWPSSGQSVGPCSCSFYTYIHLCQGLECSKVLMYPASHLRLLTDAYELSYRLLHVQINNILMLFCLCQLGEVPDTFIWAPRILGSLPHRHGVPTTVHGLINHRHFKAWKARREEHPAMLDTSTSTPCLLAFL